MTIVRNAASDWLNRRAPEEDLIPYAEEQYADITSINQAEGELVSEKRNNERFLRAHPIAVERRDADSTNNIS